MKPCLMKVTNLVGRELVRFPAELALALVVVVKVLQVLIVLNVSDEGY